MKTITWTILLIFSVGCSHEQLILTQKERFSLGNIGLIPINNTPAFDIDQPAAGRLAGAFRKGVNWGTQSLTEGFASPIVPCTIFTKGCGSGLVFILLMSPVWGVLGGLAGSVVGANEAPPSQTVEMQNREILVKLTAEQLQEKFRTQLVFNGMANNKHKLVEIPCANCKTFNDINAAELAALQINTKMAANITYLGLKGKWDTDPDMALILKARVELANIGNSTSFYDHEFVYTSAKRKFSEWANPNSFVFNNEINTGLLTLADELATQIFTQY